MRESRSRLPDTPDPEHVMALPSGQTIAADSWGPTAGRPVLLLHGGGQTRHAWRGAGQHLGAAGYHAVAVDLRGHGDSAWADDGEYGNDAMVEDLVSVIDLLELDAPVLVGASLGGAVSLLASGEGTVAASAVVIVDTAPVIEQAGVTSLRSFMTQRPEGFASLEEVADAISAYNPTRKRPATLDGLAKNVRVDAAGRYHWHWDPKFMSGTRPAVSWEERRERMEAAARGLVVPTLLVRGGLSDLLSEEGASGFLELCPHAEYVNITGATHMVAGDRNDRFAGAVIEFLQRVAPPRPG